MNRFKYLSLSFSLVILLFLSSCSGGGKTMTIKGTFKNLKQGQLYVFSYSPEWDAFDTIFIDNGSFAFKKEISDTTIVVLQYPNFMQTTVVAIPGKTIKIKGDANNLSRIDISGNEENELLSHFQKEIFGLSPTKKATLAESFIKKHPESYASLVLLQNHFLNQETPDWSKINRLFLLLKRHSPNRNMIHIIENQITPLLKCREGNTLPAFTATTLKKEKIQNSTFQGKWLLITIWSSWSRELYSSVGAARKAAVPYKKKLALLNICLDADTVGCNIEIKRDTLDGYNVCDCQGWASPLVRTFGVRFLPENILVDNTGKILVRNIKEEDLETELKKHIK